MADETKEKSLHYKFFEVMKARGVDYKCTLCSHTDMEIENFFFLDAYDDKEKAVKVGLGNPHLAVNCKKCNKVAFFDATDLGMVAPDELKSE